MIDLKTLAIAEDVSIKARGVFGAHVIDIGIQAEILRLAMRYLALRERYVDYWLSDDKAYGTNKYGTDDEMRAEYDADADKTIQEMLK